MKAKVTLTLKEQKRLTVLNDLDARLLTIREASVALGITRRHVSRLRTRYRLQGAAALAHGNRGRPRLIGFPVSCETKSLSWYERSTPTATTIT